MSHLSKFRTLLRRCRECVSGDPDCPPECDEVLEMTDEEIRAAELLASEMDYEDRIDHEDWVGNSLPWWYDGR